MKENIIKMIDNKVMRVIRVTKTEYELENGDIYPHLFELDNDVSVEEFQKILDESKNLIINHLKNINGDE
jgi:energy-converting hydrogenase A subunit M